MKIKGKLIILIISAFFTIIFWQTRIVMSNKLPAVFFICFGVLNIAVHFIFSKKERDKFKKTYQKFDKKYNPDSPKPRALIILSVIGIIGSLAIGMPVLVTYVFCGLLGIFLFYAAMMK